MVVDADLALADELLALRRGRGADALVGWWIAHSPAFDPSIVPRPRDGAGRLAASLLTQTGRPWPLQVSGGRQPSLPARAAARRRARPVVAWEHLASKPRAPRRDRRPTRGRECAVAQSYPSPGCPEIADAGREDDALTVVRAELTRRRCLEPDALIAGVAAREGSLLRPRVSQ